MKVEAISFAKFFSNKNTISNLMKNYIGGLQKFTPKLMPIHAPNINSYRTSNYRLNIR